MSAPESPTDEATDRQWILPAVATAAYAAIVIVVSVHHEPWRDEVVPLSMARQVSSLAALADELAFEGHPILWYALLRGAWLAVGASWVLKALNAAAATGAIALLMFRAGFPLWLRCLFAFSFIPLYQYGVINRAYALGMLALFAYCTLDSQRPRKPIAIALVLAALANTHVFGFVMAGGAGLSILLRAAIGPWPGFGVRERIAVGVYGVGLGLAALVALPEASHVLGGAVWALDPGETVAALIAAILQPGGQLGSLFLVPYPSLWLWAYFLLLARRPAILCFLWASLAGFQLVFGLVLGAAPWHAGSVLLVVVASMWMDAASPGPSQAGVDVRWQKARAWVERVLAAGLTIALLTHLWFGWQHVAADVRGDYSSSAWLAALLESDPSLAQASIIAEPDALALSLAYYRDAPVYLPREGATRGWARNTPSRQRHYDLDSLLADARSQSEHCRCPVVILVGWDLGEPGVMTKYEGTRYEESFAVTAESRAAFLQATERLAERRPAISDESYDVYRLR